MFIQAAEKIHAPEFPPHRVWLNSEPLSLTGLRGKTVLVDFWDYTCINCLRTLPYVEEWYRRYGPPGLVVVGVHTPEFRFAQRKENVEAAIEKLGITYPVVLDNDYKIWSLYANQFWPRKYLVDARGYIVYDHAGEGGYHEAERAIQEQLRKSDPEVQFPPLFDAPGTVESGGLCYRTTPELYLGYERGRIGNAEGYRPDTVVTYRDKGGYMDSYIYAHGPWMNFAQSLRHARKDAELEDYIALTYHALSVNAVIGGAAVPYRVEVRQDGRDIAPENWGEDLRAGADGVAYLEVRESRMYRVVRNSLFGEHTLRLCSSSEDFEIYSFTFGSCRDDRGALS